MKTSGWEMETVGREYSSTRYGFLMRLVGGDGKWYGWEKYQTEEEARKAMKDSLKGLRHEKLGCVTVVVASMGQGAGEQYERKVVKIVRHHEVLAVAVGPV